MSQIAKAVMSVMGMVAATACAADEPTLPGAYEGKDASGNADYPATWTLTLEETADGTVEGAYEITGIGLQTRGAITGTFADPALTLVLTPDETGECRRDLSATWRGDEIAVSYTTAGCFALVSGTLTLAKQ